MNARRGALRPLAYTVLLLASLRVHKGLRDAPVPFTDESGYASAFWEGREGAADAPRDARLYPRLYAVLGRAGGDDARSAHRGLRFAASTLSGIALYEVLLALPGVSWTGALAASLLWGQNLVNTPSMQHGNVNLLAFALGAFALAFALAGREGRAGPRALALVFAALAAWCHVEYALFLLILLGCEAWRGGRRAGRRRVLAGAGVLALLAGLALVARPVRARVVTAARWADGYLTFGLRQCYSASVAPARPGGGDPMAESSAFQRDFPGDASMRDVLLRHPLPLLRYLLSNGARNVLLAPRRVTSHHSLLAGWDYELASPRRGDLLLRAQSWGITLGLCAALLAALAALARGGRDEKVAMLLAIALGATSLVALLVLIPTPRYWIPLAVLPYWGGAWAGTRLLSRLRPAAAGLAVAAAALLLSQPAFAGRVPPAGREAQDRLLATVGENVCDAARTGAPAVVGGFWPGAFLAYLPPLPGRAVNLWELPPEVWRERLRSGGFDVFLWDARLDGTNAFGPGGARVLEDRERYRSVAVATLPELGEVRLLRASRSDR